MALSNIYDGTFCENSERLLTIDYFHKNFHHRYIKGPRYTFVIIGTGKCVYSISRHSYAT